MQYTLRNVPRRVDEMLRRRARMHNKSLNQVLLDVLSEAAGLAEREVRYRELGDLAGTWVEDPEFDEAIANQDVVDPELWK